ncbi:MAG TPA: peptide chain release factor 2, partial [Myxococcota bacterium]|nr:peptide chain release factor 2 [Myxococcota bacterium]
MSHETTWHDLDSSELKDRLRKLRGRFDELRGVFDLAALRQRLEALETETARPDLWEDRGAAEALLREKRGIEREVGFFDALEASLEDAAVLLDLAAEAEDAQTLEETAEKVEGAERELEAAELRSMLGGEHDAANAIVSINAGAGGTDACDWAEMLMRMYLRWAERHGFQAELLDQQPGEEAGLRSATFTVKGDYAYGYLKAEEGVHRLVRISPFDSQARRHTAFASVTVAPEIDDAIEVELDENEIRVDTYRASGAGGQHVNKTDSAVRMTHLPTGIVVQCQNERSQHKNRATAMKLLRARLYEHERARRDEEVAKLRGEQRQIEFGSQIRSYTLHPSQRVKDHRTEVEVGNVDAVLDGDLDRFIRAMLVHKAA